jgi:cyclopropane-fatty-acyl-phospholipid synthase
VRLQPGMRLLDIGCCWGGLALALARQANVEVTGITLSNQQAAIARAEDARLENRVRIELMDYRDVRDQFDRVVSVGMFEHVGVPNYHRFFDVITRRLADDGAALIHSIGPQGWSWRDERLDPQVHLPGRLCAGSV